MLVREIMNTSVKSVTADTKIRDVAVIMCFNKISGLPVIDDKGNIIGVISEKDILYAMYPEVDEFMQSGRVDFEALEEDYHDIMNLHVKELMKTNVYTVSPEVPILRAVAIMGLHKIRRIPVAENNRLVGIISIGDVHKAVFQKNLDSGRRRPVCSDNQADQSIPLRTQARH